MCEKNQVVKVELILFLRKIWLKMEKALITKKFGICVKIYREY